MSALLTESTRFDSASPNSRTHYVEHNLLVPRIDTAQTYVSVGLKAAGIYGVCLIINTGPNAYKDNPAGTLLW
jgi:hypothetical protein